MTTKAKTSTIITKYGTKINTTGLSPEQVTKVRKIAEDKGAYGAKGAALADQFRKQGGAAKGGTVNLNDGANLTNPTGVPGKPLIGDPAGPPPATPDPKIPDLSGAPKVPGAGDLTGDAQAARDAAYGYITKDYATQKQQKVDAAKQELSNRGIPIDPDPNSLYGRTLQQIDKEFQGMDDQAKNQAFAAGNADLSTLSTVGTNAFNAFLGGQKAVSDAELAVYGINANSTNAERAAATQKYIADQNNKTQMGIANKQNSTAIQLKRLGMGGGGGDKSPIIGGSAPGFNTAVSNG